MFPKTLTNKMADNEGTQGLSCKEMENFITDSRLTKDAKYEKTREKCESGQLVSTIVTLNGEDVEAYFINVNGVKSKHGNYKIKPAIFFCIHCSKTLVNFDTIPKHKANCDYWKPLISKEKEDKMNAAFAQASAKVEATKVKVEEANRKKIAAASKVARNPPKRIKKKNNAALNSEPFGSVDSDDVGEESNEGNKSPDSVEDVDKSSNKVSSKASDESSDDESSEAGDESSEAGDESSDDESSTSSDESSQEAVNVVTEPNVVRPPPVKRKQPPTTSTRLTRSAAKSK